MSDGTILTQLAQRDGLINLAEPHSLDTAKLAAAQAEGLIIIEDNYAILTELGKERVQQQSSEQEHNYDFGALPFDPQEVRIQSRNHSVFDVLDQMREGYIRVNPDFQRNFVWDRKRQSALIESLLLHIPLPSIYFSADETGVLNTIDGLQRLSTLKAFCFTKDELLAVSIPKLKLTGLQYFHDLNGKTFEELPVKLKQTLLRGNQLQCYIIESATSRAVQFEIFSRLNRGGLTLRAQELRHALYQGQATKLLKNLAQNQIFLRVTGGTLSPLRMDDQECILRFITFYYFPYDQLEHDNGLDSLLNKTMEELNQRSKVELEVLSELFEDALQKVEAIFGRNTFRRYSQDSYSYQDKQSEQDRDEKVRVVVWRDVKLNPINKTLFETWLNLLRPYSLEQLQRKRTALIEGFEQLQTRNDFIEAIAYNTGSQKAIETRFRLIKELLQQVLG